MQNTKFENQRFSNPACAGRHASHATKFDKQARDVSIDIIKALGIFCMVAGHCAFPGKKFIYLFHMAVFFIASGYCYKEDNSCSFSSLYGFIKRKFSTLWFPYVLWTAVYSCLHNFFIQINVYTDNSLLLKYVSGKHIATTDYWTAEDVIKNIIKSFLLHGGTQMGSAFWFIAALMELSIAYCVIDYLIKNIFKVKSTLKIQIIISLIFLCLGFGCHLTGRSFFGIDRVLSYYVLFHGGYTLRKSGISSKERTEKQHIMILTSVFIILLICNKTGSIALDENSYENPVYFLIASFAGWQLLYEIAHYIQKAGLLERIAVCVGQNTMAVVILHFLCFKIVSYVGILIKGQPLCLAAAFPVLYRGGAWWIAYSAVGLIIPVSLSLLWKRVKKSIFRKNEREINYG